MFDHSVKVPRLYKTAAKIARDVSDGKGSIKQLVYEGKHPNIKALYALVVHTFQRTNDIEQLFKKSRLLVKEPRFDPWLAKVLVTELLWGKKRLASQSKPVTTILAYEQIFKAHLSDVASNDFEEIQQVEKPRYVRINTLKTSINEAVEAFRDEGWILKRYTDSTYMGFLEAVHNLEPEEFMIDFHIPYLLIFPPKTQFYQHQAYKKGSIILQDKASCLPVHILNPKPGSTVLDMCAAPGMKTTQCAAIIEDSGKIHAVEIGKKRFETLNKIVESSGATCVNAINADVTTISGENYPDIEYIIVDPSCSGSGITDRVEVGQQEIDQYKYRLEKLAGFQITILRRALTRFPKAKRVVYSTCSVYPEENEDVVRQVLETCIDFKLVPAIEMVKNEWNNFGSAEFGEIGSYCLYAKPDIDLTSGFFVAVFERLETGERNQFLNARLYSQKMQRWKENKENKRKRALEKEEEESVDKGTNKKVKTEDLEDNQNYEDEDLDKKVVKVELEKIKHEITETPKEEEIKVEASKDKKKKKKIDLLLEEDQEGNNVADSAVLIEDETHKKKKKMSKIADFPFDTQTDATNGGNEEVSEVGTDVAIKKKKKKAEKKEEETNFETKNEKNAALTEEVHKKKKKKNKVDNSSSENQVDHTVDQIIVDEGVTKKKKSKKKDKEDDTGFEAANEVVAHKNKKKKNNVDNSSSENHVDVTVDHITVDEEVTKKKKSKKKDKKDDTFFEAANEEVVHKKKKKKNKVNEPSSDNQVDVSSDLEEIKPKKKKKKSKEKELE